MQYGYGSTSHSLHATMVCRVGSFFAHASSLATPAAKSITPRHIWFKASPGRLMRTSLYDAVVWIDDDILITEPTKDPIYEGLKRRPDGSLERLGPINMGYFQ